MFTNRQAGVRRRQAPSDRRQQLGNKDADCSWPKLTAGLSHARISLGDSRCVKRREMLPHVSSSSHRSRLLLVVGQNNAEPAAASAPFEEPKRREGGLEHWLDSSAPAPVRATDVRGGQLAGAHGAACVVTAARRFRPWTPVTDACVFTRSKSQSRAPNPPPPPN